MLGNRLAAGRFSFINLLLLISVTFSIQASAAEGGRPAGGLVRLTAAQFSEPFIATEPTLQREDAAVMAAVEHYRDRRDADDYSSLNDYLKLFPHSGWRVAILTNLGLSYYHDGYFSRAIDSWEQAWAEGRTVQDAHAKPLVDRAIGELMRMHARLGHADRLAALFQELGDRPVSGPATEAVQGAREGLWMMRNDFGTAYLCGPMALKNLLLSQGAKPEKVSFIETYRSGPQGVSLQQVGQLATQAGLSYRIIFRQRGQQVPMPAIVHWKVGHFAAIIGEQNGRFRIQDPTFGQELWISRAALEAETSGYFLVPSGHEVASWRQVSSTEAGTVRGMGLTGNQQPGANTPGEASTCNPTAPTSSDDTESSTNGGICGYSITMMTVGVRLTDTPVGYTPPVGPDAHVMLVYNQREDSQPSTFGSFNVSPKWTLNGLSYIEDDPRTAGSSVMRYVAGGGSVAYNGYSSTIGTFTPETRDMSQLVRTGSSPVTYERHLRDGSKEVYAQSNGATSYPRRVFLTQLVDRFGNAMAYAYDAQLRLTAMTDATGRQTTFSYELRGQPLLITKITDPFGRSAQLTYNSSALLSSITDVLGLTSQFTYDTSGIITALTTPYGTSKFVYGQDGTTRFVNATDALGQTERVEFHHQAPGIAYNDAAATVPKGLPLAVANEYLYYRNSFYWDKHAYAVGAGDYTKALITHFHHWSTNTNDTARSIESIKRPLENRVWYTYPGQTSGNTLYSGTFDHPTATARVLDDGTTQATKLTYNSQGNVTDMIDPVGRETQLSYAPNGIDLVQVQQKSLARGYSLLSKITYNSQHLPLTVTDAARQTTTYSYNSPGQPLTVTDALGQVMTLNYDGQGYLQSVLNANKQTQASFTYDGFGRVSTRTDSEGYTVSYQYDSFDRLTAETYPDGTARQYGWDKLDLATITDRQGRTTSYAHDAIRQLTQVTDPLKQKTFYAYYENGTRKSLIDQKGNTTSWNIDLESRVTSKMYADGKGTTNVYEASTSRLKAVTDALAQVKQYSYTVDDQLAGVSYAHAVNPTPSVSWAYDPYFVRQVSMTDGSGATNYTYQPAGSLGALQLAQEVGPYGNDSIGYQYDALGRLASRTVAGSTETFHYDSLNRMSTQSNALGVFNLSYLGQTRQVISQQAHTGVVGTRWSYEDNANDRRLKSITNSGSSRNYNFSTTPENLVSQLTEVSNPGSAPSTQTWSYKYDDLDQLREGNSSLGITYSYEYDAAGNVISQQTAAGNTIPSYNSLNQITDEIYDANGNLLDDGKRTYSWDAESRLVSVASKTQAGKVTLFRYDGLDRRIAIVTNGNEIRYLWCSAQLCEARSSADAVTRRYFDQGELISATGTQLYYAQDQLGSVRDVVAAQNGTQVASYDYSPYGIGTSTTGGVGTDLRFARMFYEANSGLYLTMYRGYDPGAGRWVSRDPLQERGGLNLYAYAGGDPVIRLDVLGLCTSSFSDSGSTFLKSCENLSLTPYPDSKNNCTVGYGHLLHQGACTTSDASITQQQADTLFTSDLSDAVGFVSKNFGAELNQSQFDAITSLVYNLGIAGFQTHDVYKDLVAHNYAAIPADIRSLGGGGAGIPARRSNEANTFMNGVYPDSCYAH